MNKLFCLFLFIALVTAGCNKSNKQSNQGAHEDAIAAHEKPVRVSGVSLNIDSHEIIKDTMLQLFAQIEPPDATDKGITWTSNSKNIADIDADGIVTTKAKGTAKITVKTSDGGKTAVCTITVKDSDINMLRIDDGVVTRIREVDEEKYDYKEDYEYQEKIASFYITPNVVTQQKYEEIMGNNPSWNTGGKNLAVEQVSFFDAAEFCNILSLKDGLTPVYQIIKGPDQSIYGEPANKNWTLKTSNNSNGYRLPTDDELEVAYKSDDIYSAIRHEWFEGTSINLHKMDSDTGFRIARNASLLKGLAPLKKEEPKMALIKGGSFTMGSPADESERGDDETAHQVTVSSFYLGIYPVLEKDFLDVTEWLPYENSSQKNTNPNQPINRVDWYDAIDYCNKRSIKEGLTPAYIIEGAGTYNVSVKWDKSANGYRLPTEAEWEYACRAGTTTPFNTGFNITTNQANYKGDEPYNNYAKGESRNKIIDAGAFPANSWGLFDMHGNIAEWCWDWYGPYPEEAQTNPQGAESGTQRVLRGGTARSPGKDIRSASRAQEAPERTLYSYGGFRVARSAEPEKSAPITAAAAAEPSKIFANMVSIRGGSFAMGSPSNDPSRLRDEAQRNVLVSSFYMAKIPVTQKEYEEIMGTNPSRDKNNDMPVEYVKWEDAITYCIRLSEKEGLKSAYTINRYNPTQSAYTAVTTVVWHRNADGYRLPTEAEWEYACRAGSTTRYHTGNDILHTMASFNRRAPTVPASFPPNAWGLYDMHGNQWEWCWDWYGEYSKDDLVNPTGASYGSKRVLRGGGYSSPPLELRSAYREGMEPQYRERNSFRLVRSNFSNEE